MIDVIVTTDTERRGVFFGQIEKMPTKIPSNLTLKNARMVMYWPSGGVFGLAGDGPPNRSKVSPPAASLLIDHISGIAVCTEEASERWATYK